MIQQGGGPYLLTTNSIGMRSSREYSTKKPNDRRRFLLLGDSYSAGTGVNNGDRFSDQLEKSTPNLDIMNFGLAASGTDQQVLVYEAIAKFFEADGYIFAPCTTNILRNQLDVFPIREHRTGGVWYRPKPYFTLDAEGLILHNQPVPNELLPEEDGASRVRSRPGVKLAPSWEFGATPSRLRHNSLANRLYLSLAQTYTGFQSAQSHAWLLMRRIIERFLQQVKGKPTFIVPLPTYQHFMTNLSPSYITRFSELDDPSARRYVLDVLPSFKRLPTNDRKECYFEEDLHYTAVGHQVVSECIFDALKRFCPEVLG